MVASHTLGVNVNAENISIYVTLYDIDTNTYRTQYADAPYLSPYYGEWVFDVENGVIYKDDQDVSNLVNFYIDDNTVTFPEVASKVRGICIA